MVAVILGGGRGTRLYPLTQLRSKPAVPLGGKYRLIDIPISNCINSGLGKIFVLTQFQAARSTGTCRRPTSSTLLRGFVEILAAEQTEETQRLVPGHGRRRPQPPGRIDRPVYVGRPGPLGRPALPHGLPRAPRGQHRAQAGRHHHRRHPRGPRRDPGAFGILRIGRPGPPAGSTRSPSEAAGAARLARASHLGPRPGPRRRFWPRWASTSSARSCCWSARPTAQIDFGRHLIPDGHRDACASSPRLRGLLEDIGTIATSTRPTSTWAAGPPSASTTPAPIYTRPRFLPP